VAAVQVAWCLRDHQLLPLALLSPQRLARVELVVPIREQLSLVHLEILQFLEISPPLVEVLEVALATIRPVPN
jgi:hypothetical protein